MIIYLEIIIVIIQIDISEKNENLFNFKTQSLDWVLNIIFQKVLQRNLLLWQLLE